MQKTPDMERLRVLESKFNLSILLFILQNGTTTKMELYNNISRNPRMPEKLKELEELELLTVNTHDRISEIRLTDKGEKVAEKIMDIACELETRIEPTETPGKIHTGNNKSDGSPGFMTNPD